MIALLSLLVRFAISERSFKIVGNEFQMDGKPFQYISGSFHYFRQNPEYWEENMKKMRHGGCNCVQTYVAWNLHEPKKGVFNFEGMGDIVRWVELAAKYGIYVILRPGPYICGEWELGGYPYWMLKEENMVVRSSNEVYMKHVTDWFTVLFGKLKPHMYHNGGNIILVQIENEYGSYSTCDQEYLGQLADLTEEILGKETQLFTTDGSGEGYLKCGSIISRAYATVDFGAGDPTWAFELERTWNNGAGPYVNSEFYTGWLDHWGDQHHKTDAESISSSLDKMLSMGGSANMYMYFGGTNFYFYNGANGGKDSYAIDPTSYDYDAPLSETGDMTWKYEKIREVAKKYFDVPDLDVHNSTKKSYGTLTFTEGISIYDALPTIGVAKAQADTPMTMEDLDVDYGFVLYQTNLGSGGELNIPHVKDRGYVFVNKERQCIIQHAEEKSCQIDGGNLDILVENMGRLNYGYDFWEKKGITDGVKLGDEEVTGWTMTGFNLTNIGELKFTSTLPTKVPSFYKAKFTVDELGDTFINPTGWIRGTVFVNNYNIGRYWNIGPQLTLYIPKYLLKVGENEIIVFDYESQFDSVPTMSLDDVHQIDIN
ncbi:Beta-galactosidase [Tritrichomonas foetus]|uniref:Beta-galactosidase n=1 Tax=Tritrichomonas foetus TaxID=1144522 RepID=A0A1J4JF82_9EUKA|nr:Beta-galactosidase [Tritrichomonas foetus]|eukprot:OHS97329.1 Beta-galactosidase [Tritrichomonas foetus]